MPSCVVSPKYLQAQFTLKNCARSSLVVFLKCSISTSSNKTRSVCIKGRIGTAWGGVDAYSWQIDTRKKQCWNGQRKVQLQPVEYSTDTSVMHWECSWRSSKGTWMKESILFTLLMNRLLCCAGECLKIHRYNVSQHTSMFTTPHAHSEWIYNVRTICANWVWSATLLTATYTSLKVVESSSNLCPVLLCLVGKALGLVQPSCGQCMAVLSETGVTYDTNELLHDKHSQTLIAQIVRLKLSWNLNASGSNGLNV